VRQINAHEFTALGVDNVYDATRWRRTLNRLAHDGDTILAVTRPARVIVWNKLCTVHHNVAENICAILVIWWLQNWNVK